MTRPAVVLVTDARWPLDHTARVIEEAARALGPGALLVQLRDKAAPLPTLGRTAELLRDVTARARALFLVNAPTAEIVALAAAVGADGVHVPCRSDTLASARARITGWLTTPAHTDEDVATAADGGATGVLVSPIFASPGKGPPRGVDALCSARERSADLALYALGGVDATNAAACATAGADGVAVIRALYDATDVGEAARTLAAPFR